MTDLTVRKWGSSLGVVLPKELVKAYRLKEGDKVAIPTLVKPIDMAKIRSSLRQIPRRATAQELKDEIRKGWKERTFSIPTR